MATSIVAGGAGFIGSHLVDALTRRGHAVVVIDDLTTGRLGNLERAIASGRVTFMYLDHSSDAAALHAMLASARMRIIEGIYVCESSTDTQAASTYPPDARAKRVRTVAALIDLALEHRTRFVLASFSERAESDALVTAARHERGLDARFVRLSDCYGPRAQTSDDGVIAPMLDALVSGRPLPIAGTGQQRWSMTYVTDAIDQMLALMDRRPAPVEPLTIAGHDERSAIEIAEAIARTAGIPLNVEYVARAGDDVLGRGRSRGTAAARAPRPPATPLETGLRKTYTWLTRESRLFV